VDAANSIRLFGGWTETGIPVNRPGLLTIDMDSGGLPRSNAQVDDDAYFSRRLPSMAVASLAPDRGK
jgi:hypothetical protein